MGLIGLRGPAWIFVIFHGCPGRERERETESTSATTTSQPRSIYLDGSTPVFRPLPSSFRPSIPPFVPRPRNPLIPRDTHVRWRHRTLTRGGGGGASIVREIFETKGRNNGGSLSPRPRLLFVTCRVSSIRCLFFPPPPWTAWLPSPEFRVLFFNAKGISTKREGSVNRYGYEKARGGIFSLLFAHPTFPSRDPRVGPRIRKRLETQHAQIVGCARSIPPLFRCPSPYRTYRRGEERSSDRASGIIRCNFFEDKKREKGKLLLLLLLLFVVGVKGWRKSGN